MRQGGLLGARASVLVEKLRAARGSRGFLLVCVTGGMGAGKSTVASLLASRGAAVVDADAVAREVARPGSPTLARLVEAFGREILSPDGTLDRAALARKAFSSPELVRLLNEITHPAIAEEISKRVALASSRSEVVVVDAPLVVEAGLARGFDLLVLVKADREARLERLERRGITREDAERRFEAQVKPERAEELADVVLENSGSREALEQKVEELWGLLRAALAGGPCRAG